MTQFLPDTRVFGQILCNELKRFLVLMRFSMSVRIQLQELHRRMWNNKRKKVQRSVGFSEPVKGMVFKIYILVFWLQFLPL